MNFSKNIITQKISNENIKSIIAIFNFININLTKKDSNLFVAEFIRISKSNLFKSLNSYSNLGAEFINLFKFIIKNVDLLSNFQYYSELKNLISKVKSLIQNNVDEISSKEILTDLSLIINIIETNIQSYIEYFGNKNFHLNNCKEFLVNYSMINFASDYINYIYTKNGRDYTKDFWYEYFDTSKYYTPETAFENLCISSMDILRLYKTKQSYENLDDNSGNFILCLRSILNNCKIPELFECLPKRFREEHFGLYSLDMAINHLNKYLSKRFKVDNINDELCGNSNDLMKIKIFFKRLNK